MRKDKQKDIIRAVLPSSARKWARAEGRYIARARRRAHKEALQNLDPEDYDDGWAYEHVGQRLARLRSDEVLRVSMRRDADKLGPLRRWSESHKRKCENDEEAYEEVCKVLKPHQNVITRHAAEHVRWWFDLKDEYQRPYYYGYKPPKPILSEDQLKEVLSYLYDYDLRSLNKVLKETDYSRFGSKCSEEDECLTIKTVTYMATEAYIPRSKRWQRVSKGTYLSPYVYGENQQVREREVTEEIRHHTHWKCRNRLLLYSREDIDKVAAHLLGFRSGVWPTNYRASYRDSMGLSKLKAVLKLAKKHGIISEKIIEKLEL